MICRSSNLLLLANGPYLLLPKNNNKDGSATDYFYFVSASGGTVFEHSIPALHDKRFIRCQYGWLAIIDAYYEPSLFNILTSESISLPSIFTLLDICPTFSLDGSLVFYWRRYKVHSDVVPFEKEPLDYLCEIVTFSNFLRNALSRLRKQFVSSSHLSCIVNPDTIKFIPTMPAIIFQTLTA